MNELSDLEAALAPFGDADHRRALSPIFADATKAPARFVKSLKKLTRSWPSSQAPLIRAAYDLGADLVLDKAR